MDLHVPAVAAAAVSFESDSLILILPLNRRTGDDCWSRVGNRYAKSPASLFLWRKPRESAFPYLFAE